MSTTTYTTTIDFDYRAKRDNGRRNNTREGRSTDETIVDRRNYSCDVIVLENVEPKKKKGTLWKLGSRGGGGLENRLKVEIVVISENFLKKIVYKAGIQSSKIF